MSAEEEKKVVAEATKEEGTSASASTDDNAEDRPAADGAPLVKILDKEELKTAEEDEDIIIKEYVFLFCFCCFFCVLLFFVIAFLCVYLLIFVGGIVAGAMFELLRACGKQGSGWGGGKKNPLKIYPMEDFLLNS